jgi:hypothetical protein
MCLNYFSCSPAQHAGCRDALFKDLPYWKPFLIKGGLMSQELKKCTFSALVCCAWFLLGLGASAPAASLSQLWTTGELDGLPTASSMVDADKDGIKDILCLKFDYSTPGSYVTSFKTVRGGAFTDLHDWVTPPGATVAYFGTVDIDGDSSFEHIFLSLSTSAAHTYQGTIYVYNAQTGAQLWQSPAFSITSKTGAMLPISFSGSVIDVIGTDTPEWVVFTNSTDPDTGQTTGKLMVYKKSATGVGFSDLLFEQTYTGGSVSMLGSHYDLNRDGKADLFVNFDPDSGSSQKGAAIYYKPSGTTSFTEAVRFEASLAGNSLNPIYAQSSTKSLYPTRVDTGFSGGTLLFLESWTDGEKKNLISAYQADAPYSLIGTYSVNGRSLGVYPDDVDGDGWDEIIIDSYDSAAEMSNARVYKAQGGDFTLSQLWQTGDTSGNLYIYPHWDVNQDMKADLIIGRLPPSSDNGTYGTLTCYQYTGSTFSQLYQFDAAFAGPDVVFNIFAPSDDSVAGPTEYLHVPLDLDCALGGDFAVASTYQNIALSTEAGKITVYNLPSQDVSWESDTYDQYLTGCMIVHVQNIPSNDLLFSGNVTDFSPGITATGAIRALSCGETTGTTSSTTTTTVPPDPCAAEKLYGEHAPQTEALRQFRDTVLAKTPVGRCIIRLYYAWSPAMIEIIQTAPKMRRELRSYADRMLARIGLKF